MKSDRLKSMLLQCRQRFNARLFFSVLIVMLTATVIYVSKQTKMYEASGMLELPRPVIQTINVDAVESSIRSDYDMNTILTVMASQTMTHWVMDRLTPEERRAFFVPYGRGNESEETFQQLIRSNRKLVVDALSHGIWVRYRHPDRHMASRIVELVLDQTVVYNTRVRTDEARAAWEYLKLRADQEGLRAKELALEVVNYKNRRPNISPEEFEQDESYQALVKKAENGKNLHEMIAKRLTEAVDREGHEGDGWRISQPTVVPDEDDYLIAPLLVSGGWGALIAAASAGLASVVIQRRPFSNPQAEAS
jgi:hypothetical protein